MIGSRPDCMDCKHFNMRSLGGLKCKAFPKGIPENIIIGEPHTKPIKGQVGDYVFEKVEDK